MSIEGYAQRSHSVGIYVGGSSYLGDVNPSFLFYKPSLVIGGVYRYNINPHYSFKTSIIRCKIDASDNSFSSIEYQSMRVFSTANVWIVEAAEMVEFNFFPLDIDKKGENISPFLEFGIAGLYANTTSDKFQIALPMGLGLKYRINKRFEIALDWCFRKTFTDKLDGLEPVFGKVGLSKNKQKTFENTNDWYYTYGLSLLYNIKSKKKCQGYAE